MGVAGPAPASPRPFLLRRAAGRPIGLAAAALLAGIGCSAPPFANCTDELRVALTPRDTTVVVGATFSPSIALATCGGSKRLRDTFHWSSTEPAVVHVNAGTGRVTAAAAGDANVDVVGEHYGPLGSIRVLVIR